MEKKEYFKYLLIILAMLFWLQGCGASIWVGENSRPTAKVAQNMTQQTQQVVAHQGHAGEGIN